MKCRGGLLIFLILIGCAHKTKKAEPVSSAPVSYSTREAPLETKSLVPQEQRPLGVKMIDSTAEMPSVRSLLLQIYSYPMILLIVGLLLGIAGGLTIRNYRSNKAAR